MPLFPPVRFGRAARVLGIAAALGLVANLPSQASYTFYGSGCKGTMSVTGMPKLGTTFGLHMQNGPFLAPVTLFVGASRSTWGPTPLPFDMSLYGAPGCTILCSGDVQLGANSLYGLSTVRLTIPNAPELKGVVFYNQWFYVERPLNPLGVGASNAGMARIGD